jgi:TRAP-type mannitol/chloroaromatic compound transport system permease small subunit
MVVLLNKMIRFFGNLSAFFCLILVLLVSADALIRYFFNISYSWVIELEWHLFSLIFLLGFGFALAEDRHVRVDIFYNKWSHSTRELINVIGHLIFLIPWAILILITTWKFVQNSFLIGEGSPNPDGLPFRFIVKSAIMIGFVALLLQASLGIIHAMIHRSQKSQS